MSVLYPCLIRSRRPSGEVVVRLGVPLVDDYLEFLAGRCRPNTVLAAAYDLKVFFGAVGKAPDQVRAVDVLGFITSQRTGSRGAEVVQAVGAGGEPAGVATSTVARRLSIISGSSRTCRLAVTWPRTRYRGDCPRVVSVSGRARVCR